MKLDIRPVTPNDRTYSMDAPRKATASGVNYNFFLVVKTMEEMLRAWTKEDVAVECKANGRWQIRTASQRYTLTVHRLGKRLLVTGKPFYGSLLAFLKSVEERVDVLLDVYEYLTESQKEELPKRVSISAEDARVIEELRTRRQSKIPASFSEEATALSPSPEPATTTAYRLSRKD